MQTVKQPSSMPTRKVIAYTAGGIVGVVLMAWLAGDIRSALESPIVVAGVPLVLGGIAAYFVKDKPNVRT